MDEAAERISRRKLDHLELALNVNVDGPDGPGWDDVRLIHNCLPEILLDGVCLDTELLGQSLSAPLWITGMTGGHEQAAVINRRLARAAEQHGLAMGLGSQRAALAADELMATYCAAREAAPHAILIANIGAPQLVPQGGRPALDLEDVNHLVKSIGAQALAIHLNWLQEVVQPEGDRDARGCLAAIAAVVRELPVPVMVKETGAGMAREQVLMLARVGVAAVDVGGAGGTSMVRMEGARAQEQGSERAGLSRTFDHWGIPTAASVLEARDCGVPVVATGGIRTGHDAARAIALGAHAVGVGRPFLQAAHAGEDVLDAAVAQFIAELRAALFLTGSAYPAALRARGAVLVGETRAWADQRGLYSRPFG